MALGSDTTSSINLERQNHLSLRLQKTQVQICSTSRCQHGGNAAASRSTPEAKQKMWDGFLKSTAPLSTTPSESRTCCLKASSSSYTLKLNERTRAETWYYLHPRDYNNICMYKNRSIQNNPCDKAVCGQLLSMPFGLGGRAGPANPAYRRTKKKPEVDNWTNWPPGQITGSTEDSVVKRPASNSLQPKIKVKISALWHPLHCRDVCKERNSSVALFWSFPSCSSLFAEAESKSTERHAVRNCSQLHISWVKKQKVCSHSLRWNKVNW